MKTKMIHVITFCGMVIVLGTQALLRGRWSVHQTEPIESDQKKRRYNI